MSAYAGDRRSCTAGRERRRAGLHGRADRGGLLAAVAAALAALALVHLVDRVAGRRRPHRVRSRSLVANPASAAAAAGAALGRAGTARLARTACGPGRMEACRRAAAASPRASRAPASRCAAPAAAPRWRWPACPTRAPPSPSPRRRARASGNRVDYADGAVGEWYANGPYGRRAGLHRRPRQAGRADDRAGRGRRRAGRVCGADRSSSARGLRYGALSAVDAAGRRLPSRLGGERRADPARGRRRPRTLPGPHRPVRVRGNALLLRAAGPRRKARRSGAVR